MAEAEGRGGTQVVTTWQGGSGWGEQQRDGKRKQTDPHVLVLAAVATPSDLKAPASNCDTECILDF